MELHTIVPWVPQNHKKQRRRRQRRIQEAGQYIRYGVGMVVGISVVRWIKRKIESVPVVGIFASPFLYLMPTVLLGTAVGAAVVYGIEEGDPLAAQKKLLPQVKHHLTTAHREVASMAGEVGRGIRDVHSQHLAAADLAAREGEAAIVRLASSLDAAAEEAEAALLPVAERHMKSLQRQLQLDRSLHENDSSTSSSRRQQQQQHYQRRQRQQQPVAGDASSSDAW